ncbi:MAG: ABC transporter permease [Maledivibacter sp.]|jgi:oligopeptide transport system permease protein|nr:ABC transporter permease [Maledivibacter sp.]
MARYIFKRLLYVVLTLWVIITITFFLMNTLPGDALQTSTKLLPPEVEHNLRIKWGLDKPIFTRYGLYLGNVIKGNFGESMKTPGMTANDIFKDRFPVSARLGIQAVFIALVIGISFGIIASLNRNSWIDYMVIFIAILGVAVPSFVIAALLQKYLSGGILPIIGWPTENIWLTGFKYTVLPTLALSFGGIATYSRFMRNSVLDVKSQDYILTAEAKGVSRFNIVRKHILRNSIIPIVTIAGPHFAAILTGSFVIERIFSIPGLGEYFIESINGRDYTMIMAMTVFCSFLFIISLLIVDILYVLIDPRVKVANER